VLPFFGPSTVRDGSGLVVDYTYYDGTALLDTNSDERVGLLALDTVQTRARLLSAESMIVGDRYSFIRDVYLQSRAYEVYDGNPPRKEQAFDVNSADGSWDDDASDDSWGDESTSDSWGDDEELDESSSVDTGDSWTE